MTQRTKSEARTLGSRETPARAPLQPTAYSPRPRRRRAAAFTLIELLIVIAIIMLISGMILGSIAMLQENAKILASKTRMQDVTRRLQGMGTGGRSPATLIIDTMTTYPLEFRPLGAVVSVLTEDYGVRIEPVRPEHQSGYAGVSEEYATGDEDHLADWDKLPPLIYSIAEYDTAWPPESSMAHEDYDGGWHAGSEVPSRRRTMIGMYCVSGFYYCLNHRSTPHDQHAIPLYSYDITEADSDGLMQWISPLYNPTAGVGPGRAKTMGNMLMVGRFTNFNISEYIFMTLGADPSDPSTVMFVDPFINYSKSRFEVYSCGMLPSNDHGGASYHKRPVNIQWQSRRAEHALRAYANGDGTLATRHGWVFDWAGETLQSTLEVSPPSFEEALSRQPPSQRTYYENNPHELAWTRAQYHLDWPLYVEVKADPHYSYDNTEYDDDVGNVLSASPYLYSFAWQPSDWDQAEPGTIPPLWSMPWGRYIFGRDGEPMQEYQRTLFRDAAGAVPDTSGLDLSPYAADPDTITDDFPAIRRRTLADLSPVYTIRLLKLAEILPQEDDLNLKGGKYDFRRDRSERRDFNDAWGNPLVVGVAGCMAARYGPYPEDRNHAEGVLYTVTQKNSYDPGTPATSLEYHHVQGSADMLPKGGARDYLKYRFKEVFGSERFAYLSVGAMGPQREVYGTDNPIETALAGHGLAAFASIEPLRWQDDAASDAAQALLDRQVLRAAWLQVVELCEAAEWDDAAFQESPWDEYHKGFDPEYPDLVSTIIEPVELE